MKKVEVSIKEIILFLLRRIRLVVICALIFGVLFGVLGSFMSKSDDEEIIRSTWETESTSILSLVVDLPDYNPHLGIPKKDIFDALFARYHAIFRGEEFQRVIRETLPDSLQRFDTNEFAKVESPSPGLFDILIANYPGMNSREVAYSIYLNLQKSTDLFSRSVSNHSLTELAYVSATGENEFVSNQKKGGLLKIVADGVIGLLAGAILALLSLVMIYFTKFTVQTPNQLHVLFDIPFLGGIAESTGRSVADKLMGDFRMGDEITAVNIISANIDAFGSNYQNILFAGTTNEATIGRFLKAMEPNLRAQGIHAEVGGDVNTNVDTIKKIHRCDAVILVEQIDESQIRRINETLDRINLSEKPIVGYVLI